MRKLESLPLSELVDAFVIKWKLSSIRILKPELVKEKSYDKGEHDGYPVVIECKNLYYIAFKSNLTRWPYVERLTKPKIINPADHFADFQLSQLEGAKNE